MDRKKIEEAIKAKVIDKGCKQYISCTEALGLAEKLNIEPNKIGNICNELKIKIINCQLGCF
jgi:hypothetical protein